VRILDRTKRGVRPVSRRLPFSPPLTVLRYDVPMTDIHVAPLGGDRYRVEVSEGRSRTTHEVTATMDAVQRFGAGASAERLLEESFRFLLEREPKESILQSFEIGVIARYFPEYPAQIARRLAKR
jgi:hypothetical protein